MSYKIPGYDAWKLASLPERYMPPSIEDILGTIYVMHDEDGVLCMYGVANDYEADEWCEVDEDGHKVGGLDVKVQIAAFSPTSERMRTWDEWLDLADIEAEGWKPIACSDLPFELPRIIV